MQFKQYPIYKNSGVEWLGDVPEHWESNRLKKYLIERNEKNSPIKTDNLLSVTMYQGVIPVSEKQGNGGNKPKENLENYKISYPNDIVLNSMNVIVGSVGLNKYTGLISPAYYALYNRNKNNNIKFFSYIFHNPFFQKGLFGLGNGIMYKESEDGKLNTIRLKIPMEKLNQVVLPCPSISEQNQIVAFLDTETARIDNLVAKQEKLIELLEEQRKSIISHAVTKGLNPNALMKDSGVEWLGEVPENFNCIKLKQLAIGKLTYGANESADQEVKEHPRYIRITDIKEDGTLHPETFKSLSPETAEQYLLSNNDILFARSGATVGKTFKYSDSWGVCCFAGYLIKISINAKIANPDYIFYYLNSHAYWEYVSSNQSQSTIQNVSAEKYANFTIAVPKLAEQNAIVNYLNKETERLNILIAKQKTLIEKLKEYRSSIISHAVTGKIDIREFC